MKQIRTMIIMAGRNILFCFMCACMFTILYPFPSHGSDTPALQWIQPERVFKMIKDGSALWLIDVRPQKAYDAEHIEGSVNISVSVLKYKTFPVNRMIVIADDYLGQKKAREAASMLLEKGYKNVFVLKGGLVGWQGAGYRLIVNEYRVRGVSKHELQWAMANRIPIRILDMRGSSLTEKGRVEGSEVVKGKLIQERIQRLKATLGGRKKDDLSSRLQKKKPIVLIFSTSDNAHDLTRRVAMNSKADIRFLIGGYELYAARELRSSDIDLTCQTCPAKKE